MGSTCEAGTLANPVCARPLDYADPSQIPGRNMHDRAMLTTVFFTSALLAFSIAELYSSRGWPQTIYSAGYFCLR
jgi:hypothetical protein